MFGLSAVDDQLLLKLFSCFVLQSVERLYAQLAKRSTSEADTHSHKADVEKDVFRVLSYQAESAVIQGSFQKATACVQRCKDILMRLPRETCYLSLLCYNFGVETYELKRHEQSCFWLRYWRREGSTFTVLRLLATVYLEWDLEQYQDRALRAINMANEENLHPAGFFLKIKILLKAGMRIYELLVKVMVIEAYTPNPFSTCLCMLREATCFSFLKSVAQLFAKSPDVGKVILLHIELLLQRMKEPLAKTMIESIIAGHSTGMQLPPEILNRLHLVLWDRAAKNYEVWAKNYSETLQWYRYSLSFYSSGQTDCQNLAKLHRNMAACYLHLKEFDKVVLVCASPTSGDFAVSLEIYFCLKFPELFGRESFFLKALCQLPSKENSRHRLEKLFREGNETLEARANEAQWFRKIGKWSLLPLRGGTERFPCFMNGFSQFCPPDKAVQLAQRTCLLMAAAIELDMGRSAVSPQTKLLVQALEHVQSCREIWKGLKQTGEFPRDPTDALLLLYEFEARAKLNDTAVASLLDQVWELPQLESKTLETLASLSMEAPAHYPSLCKRALKMLLTLLRKQDAMDVVTLSKCLHSLVHLSLPAGVIEAGVHALEEAWGYFEEALSVLGSPVSSGESRAAALIPGSGHL
uniref:Protein ZIP4 homolog n=1 Tax=Varanus komodoensis TaxID=61221 RepID=A0A8D2L189_VARKO